MRESFASANRLTAATLVFAGMASLSAAAASPDDDPFQWLEDVQGEKALAWAREHNAKTTAVLEARPEYKPIYARTLEILDSKEKIPTPELLGETVYNFWKDDAHERGIWRRTTLASYRTAAPQWETVLDVDALAKADGKPWVFHGATCLPPAYARCMVSLSPGGSDAVRAARVRHEDEGVRVRRLRRCRKPSRASRGATRTRSGSAPTSDPAR